MCLLHNFFGSPQQNCIPVAQRGNPLNKAPFIGFPPCPVSFPTLSLTHDPWGHLPDKLPVPKSLSQGLLWKTISKSRTSIDGILIFWS